MGLDDARGMTAKVDLRLPHAWAHMNTYTHLKHMYITHTKKKNLAVDGFLKVELGCSRSPEPGPCHFYRHSRYGYPENSALRIVMCL